MSANCNADYKRSCDANDGGPCEDCASWLDEIEAAAFGEWRASTALERDPEKYEQDMKDAGRGHLLP